jgi:hypothetical protein
MQVTGAPVVKQVCALLSIGTGTQLAVHVRLISAPAGVDAVNSPLLLAVPVGGAQVLRVQSLYSSLRGRQSAPDSSSMTSVPCRSVLCITSQDRGDAALCLR